MKAIVVGGGPAGTVAALALQQMGAEPVVYEQKPRPTNATGSWLTLAPNGLDALQAVGVLETVRSIGYPTRTNIMVGATGHELGRIGLGQPLHDGTTALTLRRHALADALARECDRRGIRIVHDAAVTHVTPSAAPSSGAAVTVNGERLVADLVVGADGVGSRVRTAIDAAAPAARYVGLVNFGGVAIDGAELLDATSGHEVEGEAWHLQFGRRAFFGYFVCPTGDVVWFANEPRPEVSAAERAATSHEMWQQHLVSLFADDIGPAARLIAHGRLELVGDNTRDLGHVPTWHNGSTVIIGDAAHAPSPASGQGASIAIEDGVVLAKALRDSSDVASALVEYEASRRDRVERIVRTAARSSSSKAPGRLSRPLTEMVLRLVFRYAVTERNTAWMYDHRINWASPLAPGAQGTTAAR